MSGSLSAQIISDQALQYRETGNMGPARVFGCGDETCAQDVAMQGMVLASPTSTSTSVNTGDVFFISTKQFWYIELGLGCFGGFFTLICIISIFFFRFSRKHTAPRWLVTGHIAVKRKIPRPRGDGVELGGEKGSYGTAELEGEMEEGEILKGRCEVGEGEVGTVYELDADNGIVFKGKEKDGCKSEEVKQGVGEVLCEVGD